MNDHIFMQNEDMIKKIRWKYERLSEVLDERSRRVWATVEAEALGYGGQSIVAKATGLTRTTLHREELEKESALPDIRAGRIRKMGGWPQVHSQGGTPVIVCPGSAR